METLVEEKKREQTVVVFKALFFRSDPGRAHLQQKIDKWVTKLRQQVEVCLSENKNLMIWFLFRTPVLEQLSLCMLYD